jgi:hypothetical protein
MSSDGLTATERYEIDKANTRKRDRVPKEHPRGLNTVVHPAPYAGWEGTAEAPRRILLLSDGRWVLDSGDTIADMQKSGTYHIVRTLDELLD